MTKLQGKLALVTGAARGIGKECAFALSQAGMSVILSDINDPEGQEAAKQLGSGASYVHLDVSREADWQEVSARLKKEGRSLDVLVNNAGVTGYHRPLGAQDPEHASLESWREVHSVNLDGVFLGCKYGIALMKDGGGSIVNISSRSGMVGVPLAAAYASSKAGVRNHTKSVALYCAQNGYRIRCNSIHPAVILTPMWEPMLGNGPDREERMRQLAADIPLGFVGEPRHVASVVVYLASDDAGYITGAEFTIDGGILAGATAAPRPR